MKVVNVKKISIYKIEINFQFITYLIYRQKYKICKYEIINNFVILYYFVINLFYLLKLEMIFFLITLVVEIKYLFALQSNFF